MRRYDMIHWMIDVTLHCERWNLQSRSLSVSWSWTLISWSHSVDQAVWKEEQRGDDDLAMAIVRQSLLSYTWKNRPQWIFRRGPMHPYILYSPTWVLFSRTALAIGLLRIKFIHMQVRLSHKHAHNIRKIHHPEYYLYTKAKQFIDIHL